IKRQGIIIKAEFRHQIGTIKINLLRNLGTIQGTCTFLQHRTQCSIPYRIFKTFKEVIENKLSLHQLLIWSMEHKNLQAIGKIDLLRALQVDIANSINRWCMYSIQHVQPPYFLHCTLMWMSYLAERSPEILA